MTAMDANGRSIAPDVKLGKGVRIFGFTNLYGCEIGDDCRVGTFVEIQKGVLGSYARGSQPEIQEIETRIAEIEKRIVHLRGAGALDSTAVNAPDSSTCTLRVVLQSG